MRHFRILGISGTLLVSSVTTSPEKVAQSVPAASGLRFASFATGDMASLETSRGSGGSERPRAP